MFEGLDYYCVKIFSLFVFSDQKYRFNELLRKLKRLNVKLSKPTLIAHLAHLQDLGFIVRTQEAKQNVSYGVNWEKFEAIKKSVGYKKRLFTTIDKNKEAFQSLPPRDQLLNLYDVLLLGEISKLRMNMADVLEPEKRAEHYFSYLFMDRSLAMYQSWFLETFMQADEKNQKMLIEKVEGSMDIKSEDIVTAEKDQP